MDRLTSMTVFVRVTEARSFAKAAAGLGMSPTMVAKHIRALEMHLGARLIERTTRTQSLTDIGHAYLERCRDVLTSLDAADTVVEEARTSPEGTLRVTAPVTYGAHRLIPVIAEYCRVFSGVDIDLELNDRVVDLEEEGFHVGIRSGSGIDGRLVAAPLAPSAMWAAASPDYLERNGRPVHPAELRDHACLSFSVWGPDHRWRFTRLGETESVPVRGQITVNSGQALLQAALAGMGVIVQADLLLHPSIASGALVRLFSDWALPSRPMHLVYARRRVRSAKLRTFVDFVSRRLG